MEGAMSLFDEPEASNELASSSSRGSLLVHIHMSVRQHLPGCYRANE